MLAGQAGQAAVLTLHQGQLSPVKTRIGELPGRAKSNFLAISLYRDMSGLLSSQVAGGVGRGERRAGRQESTGKIQDLDEEDELLYGSADAGGGGGGCRTRARRRKSPG